MEVGVRTLDSSITRSAETAVTAWSLLPVPQAPSSHLEVSPQASLPLWEVGKEEGRDGTGLRICLLRSGWCSSLSPPSGPWEWGGRTGRVQSPLCCAVAGLAGKTSLEGCGEPQSPGLAQPSPPLPCRWIADNCGFWEPAVLEMCWDSRDSPWGWIFRLKQLAQPPSPAFGWGGRGQVPEALKRQSGPTVLGAGWESAERRGQAAGSAPTLSRGLTVLGPQ